MRQINGGGCFAAYAAGFRHGGLERRDAKGADEVKTIGRSLRGAGRAAFGRGAAAALAMMVVAGPVLAQNAERLVVKRTVDFTSADWDADDTGRLEIVAMLANEGGRLAGVAEVRLDWTWPHPPCDGDAGFRGVAGHGPASGEIVDGRLKMRLAVPVSGSYTSLIGGFLGIYVCLSRQVDFVYDGEVMEWGAFDLTLDGDRHDSTVMSSSTEGGTIVLPGIVRTSVAPAAPEAGDGVIAAATPPGTGNSFSIHLDWWPSAAKAGDAASPAVPAGTEVEMPFVTQVAIAP